MNKNCELCNHKMMSMCSDSNYNYMLCFNCQKFAVHTNKLNHEKIFKYKFNYEKFNIIFLASNSSTKISLVDNKCPIINYVIDDNPIIEFVIPNKLSLGEIKKKKDYFYNRLIKLISLS